jgi:hypothetical protein
MPPAVRMPWRTTPEACRLRRVRRVAGEAAGLRRVWSTGGLSLMTVGAATSCAANRAASWLAADFATTIRSAPAAAAMSQLPM